MVRKRSYPIQRDGLHDGPLYSAGLAKLQRLQEDGKEFYGDAVIDREYRRGQPAIFYTGLDSDHEVIRKVTYVPPSKVIPNSEEIKEVLNDMTRDLVLPEEELRLVDEARQLGWSWQRIASELQGRTPKQLMRIYSDPRTRSRPRYESRPMTASARLPATRQTVLPAQLAEILTHKPTHPESIRGLSFPSLASIDLSDEGAIAGVYQKEDPLVNRRTVNRSGGDARVTFHNEVFKPSYGYTVAMAHPTVDPSKIRYFEELHVIDADDTSRTFVFSLKGLAIDPEHCACFNIGEGKDGSPLLSWSNLYAFYQLPDGSKWAEHGYLYDREDLESYAERHDKEFMHLIPEDLEPQELIKRKGRFHSRVQNIEYECWIYKDKIPDGHPHEDDDYFYRVVFDPLTMAKIDE